jgi:hypothetical protein
VSLWIILKQISANERKQILYDVGFEALIFNAKVFIVQYLMVQHDEL